MKSKAPNSRFTFYWNEQRGRCALAITANCRKHGGQMRQRDNPNQKSQPLSMPTWDHVHPKPRTPEQEPLQLLACRACNNERGNAPATAEYMARAMLLLEEWLKTNPSAVRGVPNAKRERQRLSAAKRTVAMQAAVDAPAPVDRTKHPYIPRTGYDEPMSARAKRNAESQAAAIKGVAERMHAQGRKGDAKMLSAKAESILAAFRGKPPERK